MRAKARVVLHAVHDTSCEMTCRETMRHARENAARLAVGCGMEWTPADFGKVKGYWDKHYFSFDREACYALAIAVQNTSYIKAFEKVYGRKPFFANNVTPVQWHGYRHMNGSRRRERLAIYSEVLLHLPDGIKRGEVTSINNTRVVITCRAPRRIFKLTHEQCAEMFPAKRGTAAGEGTKGT